MAHLAQGLASDHFDAPDSGEPELAAVSVGHRHVGDQRVDTVDDHAAQLPRDSVTLRCDRLGRPGLSFCQQSDTLLFEPPHQYRTAPNQTTDQHWCAGDEYRVPDEPR